ncbi:hypothetical protein GAP32_065 [Cronobacter phage vB_CsaM_GAP32]|uniref:Uncharacterized protein n=1 Tax=Cronobacter phage vB_CsaM_GAP32 TaxID=1141136 RepID=K4F6G2_9CAUD|nr:hypothetical protein GAP32_065 [Cronobacter phage vB_CsaM_GAP32]AFC21513.1 hypothetical protein GAP32_065 [Cronobacter phage vB_CsaM_GAP32]
MNIQEICKEQSVWNDKIISAANHIDPKLLGVLSFQDLFNDKYGDNSLLERYNNEVYPLIHQYKVFMQDKTEKYLLNFINDISCLVDSTGYDSRTGEDTTSFNCFHDIPETYIPSLEIEFIWHSVMEMRYISYKPFWCNHGYTLHGNNETICVSSYSTPKEFITENRKLFQRSFGDTNLGRLERAVLWKDNIFDYPVYMPALSSYEDRAIPASYEESIRRHLILKHAIEHNIDGIVYNSIIDGDGSITLVSIE